MSIQQQNTDAENVSGYCLYDLLCADPSTSWKCPQREGQMLPSGPHRRLDNLLRQSGNKFCADCGSPDPKWVTLSHGVFICIKCSGVHRSLGVHISKVLSVKLDEWTDEQVDTLINMGGNDAINLIYEANVPDDIRKPKPDSSIEERSDFIRRKYELKQFLNTNEQMACPFPSSGSCSLSSGCSSSSNSYGSALDKKLHDKQVAGHHHIHGLGHAFRNSWRRKENEQKTTKKRSNSLAGMVEFVGLIKVNVVRGTNLAVRDMMTSDPYVILSLGNQSVKTHVIKNNLNPVWNEQLMLSIPIHIPPLKLHQNALQREHVLCDRSTIAGIFINGYAKGKTNFGINTILKYPISCSNILSILVYDKDTFTHDDFMGDAEIDIQPLVSAATASENSTIDEPMELGKWVASKETALVTDGVITLADGKVKQEIAVRLQNVERGVLEIELECLPLTQ